MGHRLGASLLLTSLAWGCGAGAAPTESEIWHAATLRPSVELASTRGEELLLARLGSLPADEPVRLEGEVFTASAAYVAASGRTCRHVRIDAEAPRQRLACDDGDGRWVFVPNPFVAESP